MLYDFLKTLPQGIYFKYFEHPNGKKTCEVYNAYSDWKYCFHFPMSQEDSELSFVYWLKHAIEETEKQVKKIKS